MTQALSGCRDTVTLGDQLSEEIEHLFGFFIHAEQGTHGGAAQTPRTIHRHRNADTPGRGRHGLLRADLLPSSVQQGQVEPVQALAKIPLGAIPNRDSLHGLLGAKVHFPPGITVILRRVGLGTGAE